LFYVIKTDDSGKIVYQGSTSENEKPYYTLESYTIDEDAEQYGIDASVSLSLKQYRSYGTATGSIQIEQYGQSASISNKRDTTGKQTAKSYTVKKGDTLWNICKKELGDGTKYKEIAQKNGIAFMVDGAQGAGTMDLDVEKLHIDMHTYSPQGKQKWKTVLILKE